MALARVTTWSPGDTLTAAALNGEFNNVLNNPTALINLSAAGDLCIVSSAAAVTRLAIGTAAQALLVSAGLLPTWGTPVLRSYLAGLTLSTAGASTTMTVAAGTTADSTNVDMLTLASSIAKTTAAWAVGTATGGLDTGTIANSTWYHFWVIKRTDTAVVDVLMSLSATAPTMPTNYTERRRIGSGLTTGAGNWTSFTQDGDYFRWAASVTDISVTNPGTAAVTRTLSLPTGVNVWWIGNVSIGGQAAGNNSALLSDLAANDEASVLPNANGPMTIGMVEAAAGFVGGWAMIRTNTSAQVRSRIAVSDANVTFILQTSGWLDSRGRNN